MSGAINPDLDMMLQGQINPFKVSFKHNELKLLLAFCAKGTGICFVLFVSLNPDALVFQREKPDSLRTWESRPPLCSFLCLPRVEAGFVRYVEHKWVTLGADPA